MTTTPEPLAASERCPHCEQMGLNVEDEPSTAEHCDDCDGRGYLTTEQAAHSTSSGVEAYYTELVHTRHEGRLSALRDCFHDGICTNYSPEKTNALCNRCRLIEAELEAMRRYEPVEGSA